MPSLREKRIFLGINWAIYWQLIEPLGMLKPISDGTVSYLLEEKRRELSDGFR